MKILINKQELFMILLWKSLEDLFMEMGSSKSGDSSIRRTTFVASCYYLSKINNEGINTDFYFTLVASMSVKRTLYLPNLALVPDPCYDYISNKTTSPTINWKM